MFIVQPGKAVDWGSSELGLRPTRSHLHWVIVPPPYKAYSEEVKSNAMALQGKAGCQAAACVILSNCGSSGH